MRGGSKLLISLRRTLFRAYTQRKQAVSTFDTACGTKHPETMRFQCRTMNKFYKRVNVVAFKGTESFFGVGSKTEPAQR
jgi:hypothetical protein